MPLGKEPERHQFVLALDETMREQWSPGVLFTGADLALRQQYASRIFASATPATASRRRTQVFRSGS